MLADLIFRMLAAHAVTDFALQPLHMGMYKSWRQRIDPAHIPAGQKATVVWPYFLGSHALVNAAGVYVATGSLTCGIAEFVAHALIDFGKTANLYSVHVDQLLHLVSKAAIVAMLLWM